jgi:hypothetical protein
MVRVPVLVAVVPLAVTEKPTDPFPDPLAPEVTVIQAALLTAVQLQPPGEVTLAEPVAPEAPTKIEVGEML